MLRYKYYRILIRIPHKLLSYLNIRWETSYLLSLDLSRKKIEDEQSGLDEFIQQYNVRELTYNDFTLGDKKNFSPAKLNIIKERFQDSRNYKAFGIVLNGELIYSCWICRKELILSYGIRLPMEEDALFLDDYCSPKYRGRGIHSMMNKFRLTYLRNNNMNKVAVSVHTYNKPALKSQKSAGFNFKSKILVYKIGKSRGYRIKNINSCK